MHIITPLAYATAIALQVPVEPKPFHIRETIHEIRIDLTKAQWDAMQPLRSGGMESEYPEERAKVTIDGRELDVAIRFKGNASYRSSQGSLKRPFKIDVNKFIKTQSINGETTINLSNNAMDPTGIREAIAYTVFRKLGVVCSRTSFAKVTLNIPGSYENKVLGLYTSSEQVDTDFLKSAYGTAPTLVLKPEGAHTLPYGDDWAPYEKTYDPKGKPTDTDKQHFMAFTKFVHEASDTEFAAKLGTYLDIPQFAKFLAGTVVTSSLDTILMMGHNFYIVRNPKSGKFEFLPWDLDLAFGGFPMAGIDATQLSIYQPVGDREILVKRFLSVPAAQTSYLAACKSAVAILERIAPEVDQLTKLVAPVKELDDRTQVGGGFGFPGGPGGPPTVNSAAANRDSVFIVSGNRILKFSADGLKLEQAENLPVANGPGRPFGGPGGAGGPGGPGGFGQNVSLNDFIKQRIANVKLQLDGKSQGLTPRSMGPGGPGRP
ncbi:MAG: CotH kinase family protein [Armatimonadota bacterium]